MVTRLISHSFSHTKAILCVRKQFCLCYVNQIHFKCSPLSRPGLPFHNGAGKVFTPPCAFPICVKLVPFLLRKERSNTQECGCRPGAQQIPGLVPWVSHKGILHKRGSNLLRRYTDINRTFNNPNLNVRPFFDAKAHAEPKSHLSSNTHSSRKNS